MGGLGNQLFQIFTLIGTSLNSKIPFYFEYIEKPDRSDRPFYWDNMLNRLSIFIKKDVKANIIYKEPHFHYKSIPYDIFQNRNIKLFGYFQSYKYFDEHKETICKMIDVKNVQNNMKQKFNNNFFTNTVSLHFRIGDYVNIQHHHPILKIEYYINSLNKLINDTQKNDWNILCFFEKQNEQEVNDKINILKNNFPDLTFQKIDNNLCDWEQIITMSLCQHSIIANSSFSWWGAYLNNNDNNVYYPDVWFGPAQGSKIMKDMYPDNWIIISNIYHGDINIYCLHYLLPNNKLLEYNDFKVYFNNLKYKYYILPSNHLCIHILDSIHFKVLTGDVSYDLYNKYITLTNQKEHSVNIYKNLINNFNINKINNIMVYKKNINNDIKTIIQDGCHRLAILIIKKYPNINK